MHVPGETPVVLSQVVCNNVCDTKPSLSAANLTNNHGDQGAASSYWTASDRCMGFTAAAHSQPRSHIDHQQLPRAGLLPAGLLPAGGLAPPVPQPPAWYDFPLGSASATLTAIARDMSAAARSQPRADTDWQQLPRAGLPHLAESAAPAQVSQPPEARYQFPLQSASSPPFPSLFEHGLQHNLQYMNQMDYQRQMQRTHVQQQMQPEHLMRNWPRTQPQTMMQPPPMMQQQPTMQPPPVMPQQPTAVHTQTTDGHARPQGLSGIPSGNRCQPPVMPQQPTAAQTQSSSDGHARPEGLSEMPSGNRCHMQQQNDRRQRPSWASVIASTSATSAETLESPSHERPMVQPMEQQPSLPPAPAEQTAMSGLLATPTQVLAQDGKLYKNRPQEEILGELGPELQQRLSYLPMRVEGNDKKELVRTVNKHTGHMFHVRKKNVAGADGSRIQ